MEWFWEVLGIEKTTNIAEIKKAFVSETRRLKSMETKEEVPQENYDNLGKAEKAAIASIERQGEQAELISHALNYREQVVENKQVTEKAVVKAQQTSDEPVEDRPDVSKPIEPSSEQQDQKAEKAKLESQVTDPEVTDIQPVTKVAKIKQAVKLVEENTAVPTRFLEDIRELLADWPRKILLKEWQSYFRYRRQWSSPEFVEIRDNFLPLLKQQLVYLPKAILLYLYDELDLATYERTTSFNWFMAISDLPSFSFEQAVYLPEEEAAAYFDRRLHLYHVIEQEDWHSRSFEIEDLFNYFYSEEGWQDDYQIVDQDVENLGAIYQIKLGIEKLVQYNEPNPAIASHLLPSNTDLEQVTNQTAKFLRIIFTSLKLQSLSLEEGLFIENPPRNYVEENLRELLVGLVFYRVKDKDKATKHFNNLANDYQGLVKVLQNSAGFKRLDSQPNQSTIGPVKTVDWKVFVRFAVIGVIGISLLGNLFSVNDDNLDSGIYENQQASEGWLDPEDPGEAFLNYYVEPTDDRDDIEDSRKRFVESWVSPELGEVFAEHLHDSDPEVSYDYAIIYRQINEQIEHYLITRNNQPYLIVELTDWETITAVVGQGWQAVDQTIFTELVNSLKITETELVESLVVGYLQKSPEERKDSLYEVEDLLADEAFDRLEWDTSIVDGVDFEKGTYQMSQTKDGQSALLIRDSQDELSLVLLINDYGQVSQIVETAYDDYPIAELKQLTEQGAKKQALPKLDTVDL